MHLKAVEIYGFKSFGERIYIDFNKGLTSIVGPNGSGKSNIMDAVLWVLGEQSYKNIRAKESSDVIFSGNGKSSNYAEVSLIIDNSDGYFTDEKETVKITRKILKNGENEYFINDKRARLKDISSLFLDTGIGKSAYSVIGQGKVERIISSSNKEIKGIIEEAAGIKRFQIKKQESVKNLKGLEDELEKIALVIKQVEDNKNNIEKQAKKAKEFLELKSEKELLQKSILISDEREKSERFAKISQEKIETERAVENYEKGIEENEKLFSDNENERALLSEKIELDIAKNMDLKEKIEIGEREKARIGERIEAFRREEEEKKRGIERLKQRVEGHNQGIEHLKNEAQKFAEKISGLKSSNEEYSKEIEILENEKKTLEIEIEVKKRRSMELEVEKLKVLNEIENSERRAKSSALKLSNLKNDMEEQEKRVTASEEIVRKLKEEIEVNSNKVSEISKRIEFLENRISETSMEINKISETLRNSDYEEKRATIKLQNIIRLEESNEGLYKGVKEILNSSIPGVCGIVVNLINIPEGLEKAVEAAIPGNLQDIVTETNSAAKRGIELLKEKKAGRASFLALDTIKVSERKQLAKGPGIVGLGSELITSEPKYKKVVDFLLGNLLVVETIEKGLEILKSNSHSGNIVTLSGELLSSRGRITGGENQNSQLTQILERRKERKNLEIFLEKLRGEQRENNQKLEEKKNILEKYENEIYDIDNLEEAARKKLKKSEDDYESEEIKLEKNRREYQVMKSEHDGELSYVTEFEKRITTSKDAKENTEAMIQMIKGEIEELGKKAVELQERVRVKKEEYSDIRIIYMNSQNRVEQLTEDIRKNLNELKTFEKEIEEEFKRVEEISENIRNGEEKILGIKEDIDSSLERYERENSEINLMKARVSALSEEERKLIEVRRDLDSKLLKSRDRFLKESETLERLDGEILRIKEELESLETVNILEIAPDELEKTRSRFKILDGKVKNFETVNLLAIEEFEVLNEKYNQLNSQYKDMTGSKKILLGVIDEIAVEIEKKFKEAYEEISRNFNEMCNDVIQNSEGKLLLTEGETLEDSGIDIVVRFKNKRQQSLSLFSGGEKSMVAIAFIMAIFMYKPSPFTFLDEIEAALDDKNTRKLINKLKDFTDRSQFILITHNKETMKESDSIFGVTMNKEIGISKIVPVKF